jgi:hypothetical protein
MNRLRSGSRHGGLLLILAVLSYCPTLSAGSMSALAQQPATIAPDPAKEQRSPAESTTLIRDLIAGRLSPAIDASELFEATFAPAGLDRTRLVLSFVADAALLAKARTGADDPLWSDMPGDVVSLAVAQADFLRLTEKQRGKLLTQHEARRKLGREAEQLAASKDQRRRGLQQQADALERFLNTQPADLALLDLQLLDAGEAALSAERRNTAIASVSPDMKSALSSSAVQEASQPATIEAAQIRLDRLRAQLLSLPREEIDQLVKAQANKPDAAGARAKAEAETASEAAGVATTAAAQTSSELLRLGAQERGGLLSIKASQAVFEAELSRRDEASRAVTEVMLRWRREARELRGLSPLAPGREENADRIYQDLVDALRKVRADLASSLARNGATRPPSPPLLDSALPLDDPDFRDLRSLRDDLAARASALEARAEALLLEERAALFTAMSAMNATRLDLIPELSPVERSRIVGFGDAGIAQVSREFYQIALTARYNFATAPKQIERTLYPFLHPTPQTIFSLLAAGLAVFVFVLWRRSGSGVLAEAERFASGRKPPTLISATAAKALRHYSEVRKPTEWLVLLLVLRWTLDGILGFVGDRIVWTVLFWLLLGILLVQLSDSLVRERRHEDTYAALRLRSLKLLAGAGAGVGMTLAITTELVGAGAIHNWVASLCWLLVPLIVIVLANWWRDRIHLLAEKGAAKNAILAAASRNRHGLFGQVMLVFSGGVMIAQGAWNIVTQRMRTVALIREIADQRRRQRAMAQAAEDAASGKYEAISAAEAKVLEPHRLPLSAPAERKSVVADSLRCEPGKLLAIVGERGLGKSTALADLIQKASGRTLRLQVGTGVAADLMDQLAEAFGPAAQPGWRQDEAIGCVVVDDVQRLVIPAIGGLRALDDLIAFARRHSDGVCWAFAIGGPAMTYIDRARSDRTLFDEVVCLPRWEADDVRRLIERRTSQADFLPAFSHIQDLSFGSLASEETPEERGRRMYFENLTEYSGGNPAIALEFWRRSLFRNLETGEVEVRTFARPATEKLHSLPEPTIFVLRTLIQMEQAGAASVQACTDYDMVIVREALHRLERLGIVQETDGSVRVALHWYVEVVRLLERQNLLVRSAS